MSSLQSNEITFNRQGAIIGLVALLVLIGLVAIPFL